jgi:hypothetical protein
MKHLTALAVLLIAACPSTDEVPPDELVPIEYDPALLDANDAGDEAWVERAVPALWGRGPSGVAEVAVIVDLVEQTSRGDVVRAMANSPEYIDRWQDVLIDGLMIDRLSHDSKPECYEAQTWGDGGPELAALVRDEPPDGVPFDSPWTMADLVQSTLRLDDLSPLYRANLFARIGQQFFNPVDFDALAYRQDKVEVFLTTYLNRRLECLPCHNSEFGTSNHENPVLDRHWEVPGYVERALFGTPDAVAVDSLQVFFRRMGVEKGILEADLGLASEEELYDGCSSVPDQPPGCLACQCIDEVCAIDPSCCGVSWTEGCADLCADSVAGCGVWVPHGFLGCQALPGVGGCDGCACEPVVCDEDPSCCDEEWGESCAERCVELGDPCMEQIPGVAPWGVDAGCPSFAPPDQVEPDPLDQPGFFIDDHDTGGSIWVMEDYLRDGLEAIRGEGPTVAADSTVPPTEAFAWMVALNIVDQVWAELLGSRLTIAHTFPRNQQQRDTLIELADGFVERDYSLVELLVDVATHPLFNQNAPADVQDAETPYYMAPVLDPWTVVDLDPAQRPNSAGDFVGVWNPRVLLGKLTWALGWMPMARFPGVGDPFQSNVQRRLGVQLEVSEPGIAGSDYQSLIGWEYFFGACQTRNDEMQPAQGNSDWIDALVAAAEEQDATVEQAIAALKDRLHGDPTVDAEEQAVLEPLSGPFDAPAANAEDGLRRVCGVLLAAPQFRLRGVPGPATLGEEPDLVVPGSSFEERCNVVGSLMYGSGAVDCEGGRAVLR